MQKNEQGTNKAADYKKAYIGNAIMLFVLTVAIILAVFAWFSSKRNESRIYGMTMYSNDDLRIDFSTVEGTMLSTGTIQYDSLDDSSNNLNSNDYDEDSRVITVYPGEKKYFKTIVYSREDAAYTGAVNLQNMLVNYRLATTSNKISISFASTINNSTAQKTFDLSRTNATVISGTNYYMVPTQPISDVFTLPAQTDADHPGVVEIYWYVTVNGSSVDNSIMEGLTDEETDEGTTTKDLTLEDINGNNAKKPSAMETIKFQNIKFIVKR